MVDYSQWLPNWLQPTVTIPEATPTPQTQFLDVVNRLMPYMGPNDIRAWAQYLQTHAPQTYTSYAPETVAAWQPPALTRQQERTYNAPERIQAAKQAMFDQNMVDPDAPAREWLKNIFSTAEQYSGEQSKRRQQEYWRLLGSAANTQTNTAGTGLLGSPASFGVTQEEGALWRPWLESFLSPTRQRMTGSIATNAPSWVSDSSLYGPYNQYRRGSAWANPRWM